MSDPWFGPEHKQALEDFWTVYAENEAAISAETYRIAEAHAELAPLLQSFPPEVRDENSRRSRERLRRAIDGAWDEYEVELRTQGAMYAQMGLSFSAWFVITGGFQRFVVSLLVRQFAALPERLIAAINVSQSLLDHAMVVIAEEYLETKQRLLNTSKQALAESEERNRILEEAADNRRFLESIIENMPAMVFVKDAAELRFVRFNRAGEKLLQTQREDLIGKNDYDFFPKAQAEGFINKDREVLEKKKLEIVPEEAILTSRGTRWLHTQKIPIVGDDGEPKYLLGISLDVTEAKQAREAVDKLNQKLEAQNQELERASRAKTDFLAMMSHELRTPLNSIIGFSEVLLDEKFGALNERQGRYLKNVHESGKHLLGLINDLLDLSKIEAGRLEVLRQACALRGMAAEAVATLRPLADQKPLELTLEAAPLGSVSADPARFKQVLYNLLSNAIKFTPAGGKVAVQCSASPESGFARVRVRDTGPGISDEDVRRLFTPFTQLANAKGHGGTGLGLALTRQLVELMGGRIGVESKPGQGTMFWVDLPFHETESATIPERTAEGASPLALVVDDDPGSRELLQLALQGSGFRTLTASSGEEALSVARTRRPDVITLDVFLPNLDGWDVLRVLQGDPQTREIPVVMVSISSDRGKAFSLGAVEHLVKPVEREALLSALGRRSFTTRVKSQPVSILAIDDDPQQLELVSAALTPHGFSVRCEKSGRSGVEAAQSSPCDLVLLDLMLPDISGIEVVTALRANERTRMLPIIMITAHQLSAADRARLNGDVETVIQKAAMKVEDLAAEIRRVLRS